MAESPKNTWMVEVVLAPETEQAVRWHIIQQAHGVKPYCNAVSQHHMKYFKNEGKGRYWVRNMGWKPMYGGFSFVLFLNGTTERGVGMWKDPSHTALFLHQEGYRKRGSIQLQEVENVWYAHIRYRDFTKEDYLKKRTSYRNAGFARALVKQWEAEPWFQEAEAAGEVPPLPVSRPATTRVSRRNARSARHPSDRLEPRSG